MMRYFLFALVALMVACDSEEEITETDQRMFEEMAQTWHLTYMKGGAHLEEILSGLDENIDMWENGKVWTYEELVKFGEHLPQKAIVDTYFDQKLLKKDMVYDFESKTYVSTKSGDTMLETSTRLWEIKGDKWKIVHMNNLIKPEAQ